METKEENQKGKEDKEVSGVSTSEELKLTLIMAVVIFGAIALIVSMFSSL